MSQVTIYMQSFTRLASSSRTKSCTDNRTLMSIANCLIFDTYWRENSNIFASSQVNKKIEKIHRCCENTTVGLGHFSVKYSLIPFVNENEKAFVYLVQQLTFVIRIM